MDLNFLVFPRPDFECSDEMFYTKLLFVPKRKRSINDVTFVVRGLKSVMNKTDLSPKRKKDNEIIRVEIQESQEKKSYLLNTPSKKKLIFGEMSGVSKLRAQETFEEKKNGKANLDSTFEKNQDEIRRVIPVMEKFVRFPQRQKKSNLICGDIDSKKEIYGPVNVPASMCIQLKKHLKFQSSKQTIWLEKNKVENNKNVGNKQLKESYSTNVFPVFVSKSNTMVNKNIHNENSNIIKRLNLKKNINVIEKYEIDFDCGDFPAPDERNQTADNEKDNHSQNLKNLLQKKSLNDLNNRFSVSPARQTIKELTDKDCSSLPQSSSKGSSFYKPIPVPTPKKPQFTSSPLDEDEDIDSLKEIPRHCISPDSKLSQYQRGKINLKTSIEKSFVPSESKSGIASHLLVRQSIERNASKNKNHLGASIHETESIPCLLIKPYFSSDFVILYFHANGEDIQQIQCLCDMMKNNLNVVYFHLVLGSGLRVPRIQRLQIRQDFRKRYHL